MKNNTEKILSLYESKDVDTRRLAVMLLKNEEPVVASCTWACMYLLEKDTKLARELGRYLKPWGDLRDLTAYTRQKQRGAWAWEKRKIQDAFYAKLDFIPDFAERLTLTKIPLGFSGLKKLQSLTVNGVPNVDLTGLNLTHLNLDIGGWHNEWPNVPEDFPTGICEMTNLEELRLTGNFRNIPPEINQCVELRELLMEKNKELKTLPDTLAECKNLSIVYLPTATFSDAYRVWGANIPSGQLSFT